MLKYVGSHLIHNIYDSIFSFQGANRAPSLDVMLLKQQVFTASGAANRLEQMFEYAFRGSHPLIQFLPQKISEWIAKNLAYELNLPPRTGPGDDWSSEDLNRILLWFCCQQERK